MSNLVELGILKQHKQRILGVFPVQRYPIADAIAKQTIINRLRMVVLHDAQLEARTTVLISLIKACNLTHHLFVPEERREARRRIDAIAKGEQIGKAVFDTVISVQTAVSAGIMGAIGASTTSTSSNS
ncbi:GOLPH3/VPS74 family protein [Chroogloeocystis siderophila]|uniref:GPP34 family phosphoprotein n=1 Tax=Chroogloeocystis siderophila 5.2 s.c.1 TaxID=247279 RepID=A0A1U7HP72_9CHRO|nr:GPP34 family phosphoprotein [Chroogloeocystis siderophila]OKH25393.1 hypothetical protein NIES1031_13535 [Chroogloeocystis siderophila 5.2 s.c.1]